MIISETGAAPDLNSWGPVRLRTEYEYAPLGLGVLRPRLSWNLHSEERGRMQTAYRIVVSRTPFQEDEDLCEMWDSGKVASGVSIQIEYDGKPLQSDTDYYWRVCIWDGRDTSSGWSETARWSMGLLGEEDWSASWIAHPDAVDPNARIAHHSSDLSEANWIAPPSVLRRETEVDMYAGEMMYFRRTFQLQEGTGVKRAWLCGTGDSRPVAFINGERAATSYHYRYPHWVEVTEAVRSGQNVLAYMLNVSAAYGVGVHYPVLTAQLTVLTDDGRVLRIVTDEAWECAPAQSADWSHGPGETERWTCVVTEARFGEGAWPGPFEMPPKPFHPSCNDVIYARRTWTCAAPIRRAFLYATALGVYSAYVNGRKADDQVLAPGWTDYRKRVMVQAYDVTKLLTQGNNTIAFQAAPGWYAGSVAMFGPYQYGTKTHALVQLHVECEDGTSHRIVSDEEWNVSRGPVRFADLLMGEIYDARLELPGWSKPDITPQGCWVRAETTERSALGGQLVPHIGPAVRIVAELPAKSIAMNAPGVHIIDFGQNLVGWARMNVSGAAGTRVRLRYAEMLNEDGSVYVTNLRGARSTDEYILKGEGEETFEPFATFHGFRYVEVSGYPGLPPADSFTACAVASDTPSAGRMTTSDPLINQLYANIVWGQRDNFLSIPTDCPQRDERLGWTGDAQVFARTAVYNMDTASFFTKWMLDVADAQLESGAVTNVAPQLGWLQAGAAGWGDAVVIVPWTMWRMYGDRRILEEHFTTMCRHMDYLRSTAPDWLRPAEGYGDWLSIEADTPKDMLSTAYFAYCADLMVQITRELGRSAEAERFAAWSAAIRSAFIRAYVREDGTLHGETQTAYVLSLHMDLLPSDLRSAAARHLAADIEAKGVHLSTGFIGVSYLLPVLCESGYSDLAYLLLQQETFPSWLYSVRQGATTVWERWNGWTEEHGFYSAVMNSFNHYSLGSVGEWMFRYMAGIESDPSAPGFKHVLLRPVTGGTLTFVEAEYESMYGTIATRWDRTGDRIRYRIYLPANTEATLVVPAGAVFVQEGAAPVERKMRKERVHLEPGSYELEWQEGDESELKRIRVSAGPESVDP